MEKTAMKTLIIVTMLLPTLALAQQQGVAAPT